jgi:DNA-binding HxlR family transcriptional regulator
VLTEGNRRFNEMQRLIDGISAKVLSTELKDLELNGFVRRNVFTGTPVVVEYELTEYAETLGGVLQALSEWGSKAQRDGEEKYAYAGGGCLVYVLVFSLHFCCYSNTNADNTNLHREKRERRRKQVKPLVHIRGFTTCLYI